VAAGLPGNSSLCDQLAIMRMVDKAQSILAPGSEEPTCLRAGQKAAPVSEIASPETLRTRSATLENFERDRSEVEREILIQALAQTSEAILILDKELRVSYVNAAFCRQVSCTAQELVGNPITALGPPPIPGMPREPLAFEAWIRERGSASGQAAVPVKNGIAIPAYMTISPVSDAHGNIVAYVETHLDLRQVRQAEAQLCESEERFRAVSTAAQDAMLVLDDAGRIDFWNNAASRTFGYTAEEALGQNAHLLLAPARYHHAHAAGWPGFAKDGQRPVVGKVLELEARRKDGTEFPIELSVSAVQLAGHWHAVGIVRDITERKERERELQLFRDLLDNSNDAIEVIDPDTLRFLDVNERGCRDLGYSREELLSMTVLDIDPTFGPLFMAKIYEQIGKSEAALFEAIHRRKDGSTFPVEVGLRFVEVGNKTYILSITRDITARKRAEESLQRTNRALRTISACNTALVHAAQEEQLLADMCQTVVNQGGYRVAWIGLAEDDGDRSMRHVASAGCEADSIASLPISYADDESGQNPAVRAMRLGIPQIAKDILTDPHYASWREHALQCGYASCLALPLKEDGGETLGVLNICAVEPGGFDDDEIRLLRELADDLAFGILTLRTRQQRDHYQQENLRSLDQLKEALLGTIRAVAHMAEQRDPYTAGHQNRVADLACAIARELGLDADRIEGLRLGAMIHDIGKISIPAEILNRPGKLSAPEYEIIKTHAQAGYEIIKDINFPWPVATMVRQHHERLDGSGYPQGLKGDAICLEARILAVADVVDAICAHRPYRPALGIEEAFSVIEASRGQTLDAEVVDACLRLFRQKGYSLGEGQQGNQAA
jgi:PAS domain S-box-containing protein/putative nucleotidyltransferase with HDIG domain